MRPPIRQQGPVSEAPPKSNAAAAKQQVHRQFSATRRGDCDFCGQPLDRRWIRFEADDFDRHMPGGLVLRCQGFWSACNHCAPHVRAHRWRDLLDRVTDIRIAQHPEDARHAHLLRGEAAALWLQLERHLTGVSRLGRRPW